MMMVSDQVDDIFPVDQVADEAKNDRTLKVQLSGTAVVSEVKLNNVVSAADARVPVRIKKTVQVKMVNCQYGIPRFKGSCWSDDDVRSTKEALKQRYAQVGIQLEISVVQGPDIGLGRDISEYPNLNGNQMNIPEETTDIFDAAPASNPDEIVLYLIGYLSGPAAPSGCATPEKFLSEAQRSAGYGRRKLFSVKFFKAFG